MIRALIFETDTPFRAADHAPGIVQADARMAGLTLLRRAILTAWRAGASEAIVVARDASSARRWTASERGLPIPVLVVTPEQGFPGGDPDDRWLVMSALVFAPPALLEELLSDGDGVLCRIAAGNPDYVQGPAVVKAAVLQSIAASGEMLEGVRALLRDAECRTAAEGRFVSIDAPGTLAQVERSLYQNLSSIADGYVDRHFNRRISQWFTRLVINLPVTPNQVTWLHLALGLIAAGFFWQGDYWLGVLGAGLLQFSVALDCSDGEIARLKYQFSPFGNALDVAADNVVHIAVFLAVAKAVYVQHGAALGLMLGGLMVSGVLMCLAVIFLLSRMLVRNRPGEASTLAITNRFSSSGQARSRQQASLVEAVINEATSRDFTILVVAFALIGRLEWFAWLAAFGSHLFWVVFAGVQLWLWRVADEKGR